MGGSDRQATECPNVHIKPRSFSTDSTAASLNLRARLSLSLSESNVYKFLLLLLLSTPAQAEWRLLDLDRLALDTYQIKDYRDGYFPYDREVGEGEHWTIGAAFEINLVMAQYKEWSFYWDNKPHMTSTNSQVREAGWEWEAGVSMDRRIDLYWHHHSRHPLDVKLEGRYPLYNTVGIRAVFYEAKP